MTTPDYENAFDAWAQQQAAALRAKDWAALDLEHLAEEVEDLRKVERNAIRSRLRLAVSHLLKWRAQPERRSESWRATITEARRRIQEDLESSRNLARELDAFLAWAYPRGRREAAKDTGLPLATFPEACPWPIEQVLDEDFWPEHQP
jgi:predicted  nucleic acid-binding Zn-ribbon protein